MWSLARPNRLPRENERVKDMRFKCPPCVCLELAGSVNVSKRWTGGPISSAGRLLVCWTRQEEERSQQDSQALARAIRPRRRQKEAEASFDCF